MMLLLQSLSIVFNSHASQIHLEISFNDLLPIGAVYFVLLRNTISCFNPGLENLFLYRMIVHCVFIKTFRPA